MTGRQRCDILAAMSEDVRVALTEELAESYEIGELVGQGGYGLVFVATHLRTQRKVAIKALNRARIAPEAAEREFSRFARETKLVAQLRHPNIVDILDSGELDDGTPYQVLRYVDGVSLGELLRKGDVLTPLEAKRVMSQVLDALACAHAAGVVHRDLKPDNIMITQTGVLLNAVVLDFGIATVMPQRQGADFNAITVTGLVAGTPRYIAPEQLQDEKATGRSDLYSWALVFAEALTGVPVFEGDNGPQLIAQQLSANPVKLTESVVKSGFGVVLEKALQKDPNLRYQTAADALADLARCTPVDRAEVTQEIRTADDTTENFVEVPTIQLSKLPLFVGREDELCKILALLNEVSLITLAGFGGVGKSRTAREAVGRAGVPVVELFLAQTDGDATPAELLSEQLNHGKLNGLKERLNAFDGWILVDNAEHLLDDVRQLVQEYPAHYIVTSQVPLEIPGETVVELQPLQQEEAFELLLARAKATEAEVDRDTALQLVDALDCVPLAIELAATRASVLSWQQLVSRVQDSNKILSGSTQQHQGLESTLGWSWESFGDDERALMKVLSARAAPIAPEVIEAMYPEFDTVAAAVVLRRYGWLLGEDTKYGTRWSTLAIMRRFVLARMDDAFRTDYEGRVVTWCKSNIESSPGDWAPFVVEGLIAANILLETDPALAARILTKLFYGSYGTPQFEQVIQLSETILNQMSPETNPIAWAALASLLSKGLLNVSRLSKAAEWASAAAAVEGLDLKTELQARTQLALTLGDQSKRTETVEEYERIEALLSQIEPDKSMVGQLLNIGTLGLLLGRYERARELGELMIEIGRQVGNADMQARGWKQVAYASYHCGDYVLANANLENVRRLSNLRHAHDLVTTSGSLAPLIKMQLGEVDAAMEDLARLWEDSVAQGFTGLEFYALIGLYECASLKGDDAATYLEQAMQSARQQESVKSTTHCFFLQAIESILSRDWAEAADRLDRLKASPTPVDPKLWNELIGAFEWLVEMLQGESSVPLQHWSGRLAAAISGSIQSNDLSELETFIATSSDPSNFSVPGFFFVRLDDIARRIAQRLSSENTLTVQRDGAWFSLNDQPRVDMRRRGAAKRILVYLAERGTGADPAEASDLVEAGWPDEIITYDAAMARVYTTLNRMRALGLEDAIITVDEGYALNPEFKVGLVD